MIQSPDISWALCKDKHKATVEIHGGFWPTIDSVNIMKELGGVSLQIPIYEATRNRSFGKNLSSLSKTAQVWMRQVKP